jgi:hypothetical protein
MRVSWHDVRLAPMLGFGAASLVWGRMLRQLETDDPVCVHTPGQPSESRTGELT